MKNLIQIDSGAVERAFRDNNVSGIARGVYMAMVMQLKEKNRKTIQTSFKELSESSGFERKSVMKAIRELAGVLVQRTTGVGGQSNTYELLIGINSVKKELLSSQNKSKTSQKGTGPNLYKTIGVNTDTSTSPQKDSSHVRAYNTNLCTTVNKRKEQQQEQEHVVVFENLNFNFRSQSHFRGISKNTLRKWSTLKGPEFVQRAINKADSTYGPAAIVKNPGGLLRQHVFADYDLETPEDIREISKQEKEERKALERFLAELDGNEERYIAEKETELVYKAYESGTYDGGVSYYQLAKKQLWEEMHMGIGEQEDTDLYLESAKMVQKNGKYDLGTKEYEDEVRRRVYQLKLLQNRKQEALS